MTADPAPSVLPAASVSPAVQGVLRPTSKGQTQLCWHIVSIPPSVPFLAKN